MPVYTVKIRRWDYDGGAVEAISPEAAVDKIIMRSEGNPKDWEVVSVEEVEPLAANHDGPTKHVERGAISFM